MHTFTLSTHLNFPGWFPKPLGTVKYAPTCLLLGLSTTKQSSVTLEQAPHYFSDGGQARSSSAK